MKAPLPPHPPLGGDVKGLQLHRRGLMGLRDAVLAVVRGNVWIDPDLSSDLLGLLRSGAAQSAPASGVEVEVLLSEREQEVLLALEKGAKVAEVARSLVLSENTIKPTCGGSTRSSRWTTATTP